MAGGHDGRNNNRLGIKALVHVIKDPGGSNPEGKRIYICSKSSSEVVPEEMSPPPAHEELESPRIRKDPGVVPIVTRKHGLRSPSGIRGEQVSKRCDNKVLMLNRQDLH